MKKAHAVYITAKKIEIPTELRFAKLTREEVQDFLTKNREKRDGWCLQANLPCSKYGARPCCPPKVPMFNKLPEHEFLYVFATVIEKEPYFELFPKQAEQKGKIKDYFFMQTSHYITRGMVGKMSDFLKHDGEQTFKVGGCNGCTYAKDGKCKDFRPALEATGIRVPKLAKKALKLDIKWRSDDDLDKMVAVSGLYTDREVKFTEVYEAFLYACYGKNWKERTNE